MDLQFQQMFQRKPNRPPFQQGSNQPTQGFNRSPNMQRPPHVPPSMQMQQNVPQSMPYRGNQNFNQSRGQVQRQHRQQRNFEQKPTNFNPGMNRNQGFRNEYQNQNPKPTQYQETPYNQSPQKFRQPRQFQNRQQPYQARQPYQGRQPYQKPRDHHEQDQRRSQPYDKQPYNKNQQKNQWIPPPPAQRNPKNPRNQYKNTNDQDQIKNAMNQFFEQQFQPNQGRGRERGRGNRGRPNNYERGENQHQRPFKSEMDKGQNKERLQKFRQKPIIPRQEPNKKFIKKDEQQQSHEVSIESERSQSNEYSDEGSRSGSYSGEEEERSGSQKERSGEDQGEYSQEGEEQAASQEAQQSEQKSSQMQDIPLKLPSIKSINDISTNAINDMCSKQEFHERSQTFEQNNRDAEHSKLKLDTSRSFSIFEINRRTLKPDYALALKRFKRSAERAEGKDEDDTKDCRRSIKALVKVMNHINKEIIDADNMRTKDLAFPLPPGEQAFEFIHVYDFLWDRMREMIKDITRLSQKEKITKQIITICEQIARFFILSINEGRKKYNSKLKFDERMNIQSIIKVISNLMDVYRESRMNLKSLIQGLPDAEKENLTVEKVQALMHQHGVYISPHQPQLSAYSFLFSDDRKKEFYRILTAGFEDPQTQSESPLINSDEMQRALAFHRTLNERNIEKYFDQIQNSETDYVFSCLMLKHLQMMRKQTSKMLFKSHYYKDDKTQTAQKSTILAETLRQTLRFPESQTQEFVDFLNMLGVRNQGKLLMWRDGSMNEDHYRVPEYIYQHDKTERKNWTDEGCKKNIYQSNKLSREELVKCSWKNSTYSEQIISFFLGKALEVKPVKSIKPKVSIPKEIPTKSVSKQSIQVPKEKEKHAEDIETQKQKQAKQAKNLLTLNEMRKGLQKKAKRSKFLQKIETQIHELFKHTDQAKIINRKKALAILDEQLMYYHDKMLRIAFDLIDNESRKKNLLANVLIEIKTYSGINKQFNDSFSRLPYEFEPINKKNIVPSRTQKGLMSGILSRAHFKAQKVSHDSFEDYLNKTGHSFSNRTLNYIILTTCSSSAQNEKILYDLMLYFMHQEKGNFTYRKKQLIEAINKNKTKQKQVPLLKVYFESHNVTLNLRLAKINEAKSKRKAMVQNSHVIQHLFGCHGLILMRDNSKHVATQVIIQNLQEFVSNRSRIYQSEQQAGDKQKIQTLQQIELPILLLNAIKRPSAPESSKGVSLSKISKQKYPYLTNLNEAIVIEGTTDPCSLPFMLRQQIQKQLKNTQDYMLTMNLINAGTHHFDPLFDRDLVLGQAMTQDFNARMEVRPLRELLREIRVNSSVIEEKLNFKQGDICGEVRKKFIFSFYQEYFNLCMDQIAQEVSQSYKNSIFFKKWTKHLMMTQNILTQKDFLKNSLHQGTELKLSENEQQELITHTLESQPEYNIITETFKEYEFIINICQELRMKFVGEHIEPIDTKYLIFDEDGFNVFGMPRKSIKDQTPRYQKQKILHLTHFINTIGKYLNLFDSNKTLTDEKFQNLYTIFQGHQLQFKLFNLNNLNYGYSQQNQKNKEFMINYQIEGDSLEFFSYLIGYLMDGCKHVNLLLPANFRFKISMEQFMQQSMKNLRNVINVMNNKKKDIFQNLRYEKMPSLSKLVLEGFSNQNGWTVDQTKQGNYLRDIPSNRLGYMAQDENDYINEDDERSEIDMDRQEQLQLESKVNPFKRDMEYHYKTVYSNMREEIQNPKRRLFNELKKKLKCQ